MTGTGTQTDPYIVDNWADFRTIDTSSTDIYVKWADSENKVIDFNDIQPTGFAETVKIPANVDFNGWELRNFNSTATTAISCNGIIKNLTFENCYICGGLHLFVNATLTNCIISGQIQNTSSTNLIIFDNCNVECSAMNFKITNQYSIATFIQKSNGYLRYSDIVLDISAKAVHLINSLSIDGNNRFSGKFQSKSSVSCSSSGGRSNVYNIESNQPLSYSGLGLSIFNSDIAAQSDGYGSDRLIPCTAEQLKNAEYLYSIGFPIGVD